MNGCSLKMVHFSFFFLYFLFPCINLQEVGIIIGGKNVTGYPLKTELYVDHRYPSLCPETGEEPSVPDFPVPLLGASAIYLPNIGIYICGGMNADTGTLEHYCYKYNPKEKR